MRYLIDYRYKVIHSIKVIIASILSIYERGQSKEFTGKIDLLAKLAPELNTMMAPPFNDKMIGQLQKLQTEINEFLLLPEDFERRGQKILQSSKTLLSTIDPFHFSDEETPNIRRAQIVELAQNIQIYLQRNILHLQGKASSLIDEKGVINELLTEIALISLDPFEEKEKRCMDEFFASKLMYEQEPLLAHAQALLHQATVVESLFKNPKTKKKS